MSEPIRILLIEDHPIVRDGCRSLLERRPDVATSEASSAREGLAVNRQVHPRVILLDLELPDANGLDVIAALLAENAHARIVVFSMHQSAACVTLALQRGARGYVTKDDDPDMILAAIDKVVAGAVFLGPSLARDLALAHIEPAEDPLRGSSDRERQVLALLGEGKNLTEISATLAIGYKTAANIVSSLKQKLHIATSAALIKFAVERKTKCDPWWKPGNPS